jgi:hypothetical protein
MVLTEGEVKFHTAPGIGLARHRPMSEVGTVKIRVFWEVLRASPSHRTEEAPANIEEGESWA